MCVPSKAVYYQTPMEKAVQNKEQSVPCFAKRAEMQKMRGEFSPNIG